MRRMTRFQRNRLLRLAGEGTETDPGPAQPTSGLVHTYLGGYSIPCLITLASALHILKSVSSRLVSRRAGNFTLLGLKRVSAEKLVPVGSFQLDASLSPVRVHRRTLSITTKKRVAGAFNFGIVTGELVFCAALQVFVDGGIEWIGGRAPPDEPACGFDGRFCRRRLGIL